jgi:hypothetical protein
VAAGSSARPLASGRATNMDGNTPESPDAQAGHRVLPQCRRDWSSDTEAGKTAIIANPTTPLTTAAIRGIASWAQNTQFRRDLVAPGIHRPRATVLGGVTGGAVQRLSGRWSGRRHRIGCEPTFRTCACYTPVNFPCTLGDGVTVGHGAVVHGATVEDDADWHEGGRHERPGSAAAASLPWAVVLEGPRFRPAASYGPARESEVPAEERDAVQIRHAAEHYVQAAKGYNRRIRTRVLSLLLCANQRRNGRAWE